jgi:D-alanyl-D-alanine carboxypeptidase
MSFIHGKREYYKRECASLTKIMTCYVVLELSKQWKLNIKKTEICISPIASDIRGTCAHLETGDVLTIEQMLYGLMLPSGNDAAFALAQYFGKNLFRKKYTHADISRIKSYQFNYHPYYAKYFLKEMNEFAEKLHMT